MYLGFTDEEWQEKMAEIRANNKAFITLQGGTEDDHDEWRQQQRDRDEQADKRADAEQSRGF